MATFVLIHGAWHGGWCWERVVPLLEGRGHRALAPDLPGMGEDATPLHAVTMGRWVESVRALIERQHEPVVLVGHSRGGVVISQVAEAVPARVEQLVYLAAFMLPSGQTLGGALAEFRAVPADTEPLEFSADRSTSTIKAASRRPVFYNATDDAWAERAAGLLKPEPMMSFRTPVTTTDEHFGRVPRSYVECTRDRAIDIELQRSFHRRMPCRRVITLDTDHSPFYSAPESLASALDALATTR